MSAEWVVPGAKAAIVVRGNRGPESVGMVTINRVLKRDVVCSDGARFNKDRLFRREGGAWDGRTIELLPADDPRVAEARAAVNERTRHNRIVHAANLAQDAARRSDYEDAADRARTLIRLVENR